MTTHDWQLSIIAPTELCTDERWDTHTNFVLAIVHKSDYDVSVSNFRFLVHGDWMARMQNATTKLRANLKRARRSALTVAIASDTADFFPVFPYVMDADFPDARFDSVLAGEPSACPVHFVRDTVGIAAFVARWKRLGDLQRLNERGFWQWDELRWQLRDAAKIICGRPQNAFATLFAAPFAIAQVQFSFSLTEMEGETAHAKSAALYARIFASYAREDREIVECIDGILQTMRAGELRWDLKILKSGAEWSPAIIDEIESADIFQLFWSKHANASIEVRHEWLHAIGLRRPDFIRPVYWAEPLVQPPPELQHIHFARLQLPKRRSLLSRIFRNAADA